jgi:hypothetical protein
MVAKMYFMFSSKRKEREAREKEYTSEQRYQLRQQKAKPVMEEMEKWLLEEYPKLLPKSSIGKAFYYLLYCYKPISQFLQDGKLKVATNLVENAICPVASERKNFLFCGSHVGAKRVVLVYSLMST